MRYNDNNNNNDNHLDNSFGRGEGFRLLGAGKSVDGALELADLTLQIFDDGFVLFHLIRLLQDAKCESVDLLQQLFRRRLFGTQQPESETREGCLR